MEANFETDWRSQVTVAGNYCCMTRDSRTAEEEEAREIESVQRRGLMLPGHRKTRVFWWLTPKEDTRDVFVIDFIFLKFSPNPAEEVARSEHQKERRCDLTIVVRWGPFGDSHPLHKLPRSFLFLQVQCHHVLTWLLLKDKAPDKPPVPT